MAAAKVGMAYRAINAATVPSGCSYSHASKVTLTPNPSPNPNPQPSPNPNPTPNPDPNPTPNPTPDPTPNQGMLFNKHTEGAFIPSKRMTVSPYEL